MERRLGGFTLVVEQFVLSAGDRVAIVGPSGSGKSTLLALMALALRPDDAATLTIDGVDAFALWRAGRLDALASVRARTLGFVPQTGALLPYLTLRDNIALAQRVRGRPDPARVSALGARLGIADAMDRRPAAVSVGQRQRAAVARALAHRPALVFADEPTASVHPAQADEVLALLTEAASEEGAALVMTTHDPSRAESAGYAIAPCRTEMGDAVTKFAWKA